MTTASGATSGGAPAGSGSAAVQSSVSSISSLQIQAQELVGEIDADGQSLDQLDASYQAASLTYQRLTTRQSAMRRAMAATAAEVAAARQALKEQALLAYLAGGAPLVTQIPDRPGVDRSLTVAYAEIVSGGQQTAVDSYRATLDAEARQQAALDANGRQMAVTMRTIRADADQAAATLDSQRQTLSQVKGQLVAAVARVQAQQQAAQESEEQATLTAEGVKLPQNGGGSSGSLAAANTGSPADPAAADPALTQPEPTRAAPVQASPVTAPPPTAPPPTASRATGAPATQPPVTARPAPSPPPSSSGGGGIPAQAPGVAQVLAYARAQLGKPYQWAGAGPDSFDCSGLVMRAWEQAGIDFPHLAQDQYDLTARLPLADLIPGDLVFFGTPDDVYHVGIYVGSGDMIDAPETGQDVQVQSIYWDTLLGGGRVTTGS